MVSANHWLSCTYRLSWYLTAVSVNHASSTSAKMFKKSFKRVKIYCVSTPNVIIYVKCIFGFQIGLARYGGGACYKLDRNAIMYCKVAFFFF